MSKIVVIGGTGRIGSRAVAKLEASGHETVTASPSTGVDAFTGEGLAAALADAEVVVDCSGTPSIEAETVHEYLTTSTARLLAAEHEVGVRHHVALTIVGTNRPQHIPYYAAKAAQEELIRGGGIPYSLVHATQFFDFFGTIADVATDGDTVALPGGLVQPIAREDVAAAVAHTAEGPAAGDIEIAGPERFRLDEFVRRGLHSRGDHRTVVRDEEATYFGGRIAAETLIPVEGARIFKTRFDDWLAQNPPAE